MNHQELESFVQEVVGALGDERPPRVVAELLSETLRRLVGGAFYLEERSLRGGKAGAPSRHRLYEDPQGRFVLLSVVWPTGYAGPIHDHGTWGVMAGYKGRVVVTSFRRLDDGTQDGMANISEVSRQLLSEGMVALIRPPEEEVHRVENPFREPAVTVHLYGVDQPWPHLFQPADRLMKPAGGEEHVD